MKRLITMILLCAMVLGLCVPALAEGEVKDDLTQITEHVVAVLDVEDTYTDFSGEYNDGLPPRWYLSWNSDVATLSVSCAQDGTITNVYIGHYIAVFDRFYGFDAAFSALSPEDARSQAESWLARLMAEGETARIDEVTEPRTSGDPYTFSGAILYHGLETPMMFSLSLGLDGLTNYYRNGALGDYVGEVPGETPLISEEEAAAKLFQSLQMELYYVSGEEEARLRYVPAGNEIVVDALTGEPVDMTEVYRSFGMNGMMNSAKYMDAVYEESAAAGDFGAPVPRPLTEVELSSIDHYTGVLTKEELDAAVRAIDALGLSAFTLDRCSYGMDDEGNITASLRYTCEITEDNLFGFSLDDYYNSTGWGERPVAMKYISVDAMTAALKSVSTSYDLWNSSRVNTTDAEAAAEFLKLVAPSMFEGSRICTLTGYDQETGITFARIHDGFFFPENYLYVEINPAIGVVEQYYYAWDKDAQFAPSDTLISEEAALTAYADELTVTLGLITWPEAIDYNDPVLFRYAAWGYSYAESLKLAYYYNGKYEVSGIDAITGEPIASEDAEHLTYDDIEGLEQEEMILRLAQASIGFAGGSFKPDAALTMRDAVKLLLSSIGYFWSLDDDDSLKSNAVQQGFLSAEEWDPDKELTNGEFIRMMIGASRYGYTAQLSALWDGQDGYLAIASALNMLVGTTSAPDEPCTRLNAAELLYGFMNRAQ